MKVGFIMLAHEHMGVAGALAHVIAAGGRRVAVHIDARTSHEEVAAFDEATKGDDLIRVRRRKCEWGMFSLVEATLQAAELLLAADPKMSHVALISGADLPLRPIAELENFLGAHPDTDLIEAVELSERRWVMDGLSEERFRLYHPFNWRKNRRAFDANVEIQRAIKVKRKYPKGVHPALGSQWWCLTRLTLEAILRDPQLSDLKSFYRWTWIPDESFFQTLTRRHTRNRIDKSPTLSRFDPRGLPYVFYDDHAQLLGLSDHFFARKVHPRAAKLRATCLSRANDPAQSDRFEGRAPDEEFSRAVRSRTHGREHLLSPSRFPKIKGKAQRASAFPYTVVGGVGNETADLISDELTRRGDITCHSRLFAPGDVRLHHGAALAAGCLPASPQARDFWPDQYVINLARGAAGGAVAFCLPPEDRYAIGDYIAADPGARIIWFRGAWALDLFRRVNELDGEGLAERAREAAASERGLLATFRKAGAALTIRSAAELIDAPDDAIAAMLSVANARPSGRKIRSPKLSPPRWGRARPFLRGLQKAGVEVEADLLIQNKDEAE